MIHWSIDADSFKTCAVSHGIPRQQKLTGLLVFQQMVFDLSMGTANEAAPPVGWSWWFRSKQEPQNKKLGGAGSLTLGFELQKSPKTQNTRIAQLTKPSERTGPAMQEDPSRKRNRPLFTRLRP